MLCARPPRRLRPVPALDMRHMDASAPPDPGVLCVLAAYACGELRARENTGYEWQPLAMRIDHRACAGCPRDGIGPTRVVVLTLPSSPGDRLVLRGAMCGRCDGHPASAAQMLRHADTPGQAGSAVRMLRLAGESSPTAAPADSLVAEPGTQRVRERLAWRDGVLRILPRSSPINVHVSQ